MELSDDSKQLLARLEAARLRSLERQRREAEQADPAIQQSKSLATLARHIGPPIDSGN